MRPNASPHAPACVARREFVAAPNARTARRRKRARARRREAGLTRQQHHQLFELGRNPFLSSQFDVDLQRSRPQPVEIDFGDDRVLRPEVRSQVTDCQARALADRPHGDAGVRNFPQQFDGRIENPARIRRPRAAGVRRHPFEITRQQIRQRDGQIVQAGLERIRPVHSPIDDPARQCADDDVGERLRIVSDGRPRRGPHPPSPTRGTWRATRSHAECHSRNWPASRRSPRGTCHWT